MRRLNSSSSSSFSFSSFLPSFFPSLYSKCSPSFLYPPHYPPFSNSFLIFSTFSLSFFFLTFHPFPMFHSSVFLPSSLLYIYPSAVLLLLLLLLLLLFLLLLLLRLFLLLFLPLLLFLLFLLLLGFVLRLS